MNRELIKLEMSRHYWAITDLAMRGIVDFVEAESQLEFDSFHSIEEKPSAYFGEQVDGTYYSYKNGTVGVLEIDGPIIPRATWISQVSGITSIDVLTNEYKAMLADESVKEIVLVMDTPGGVSTAISDFASLIKNGGKKTTAFTWMAASAGYWIASAADEIVSPVGGMVGSIGVVMSYTDTSARDEKSGIKTYEIVSSQSPNKRANPQTDTGRVVVQQLLDDLASGFISQVADNRGVTEQKVMESFGAGAVFAEQRALSVGMIDRVSDFESFMNEKTSNQPKQIFGFSVNNNEGETTMTEQNQETVQTLDAEAVAKAERERIQSIESLASMTEGKHPSIVAAVRGKLDAIKFDAEMTKEKAELEALRAMTVAQDKLVTELESEKSEVNAVAEHASAANTEDAKTTEQIKREARANGLLAAAKELNK